MLEEPEMGPTRPDDGAAVLVVLNVLPVMEDLVADWLLTHEGVRGVGFTTMSVGGHSARLQGLTPAEQVSGRRRRVQFEVVLGARTADVMLAALAREFADADIHYWITPVLRSGRLGDADRA
jgi:hypothetical protein